MAVHEELKEEENEKMAKQNKQKKAKRKVLNKWTNKEIYIFFNWDLLNIHYAS